MHMCRNSNGARGLDSFLPLTALMVFFFLELSPGKINEQFKWALPALGRAYLFPSVLFDAHNKHKKLINIILLNIGEAVPVPVWLMVEGGLLFWQCPGGSWQPTLLWSVFHFLATSTALFAAWVARICIQYLGANWTECCAVLYNLHKFFRMFPKGSELSKSLEFPG